MATRILSISGLRGIVGDGLEPDYVARFARALGRLIGGGQVVLGSDGRPSGEMMRRAVLAGLTAEGCPVLDAGICSTPTCGFLVRQRGAAAGLQITASHNPAEWNGLKPFNAQGCVFDAEEGQRLIAVLDAIDSPSPGGVDLEPIAVSGDLHLERVLSLADVKAIRQRGIRVVLDANHGAGAVLGPRLLEELGCDVELLGGTADGAFSHPPEPLREHLDGLCQAVVAQNADVGFAQDPDADRLAIVDDTGRYIGEELTMALAADVVLARQAGVVVVNESSSRITVDVVERYPGSSLCRAQVGEANVVAMMQARGAVLGGEGNGGVIDPRVGFVRDSFVGMTLVLEGLATGHRRLSEWVDGFPVYHIVKQKAPCPAEGVSRAVAALQAEWPEATAVVGDGLRLDWPERWVQVRGSNTEPVLRVISEARAADVAASLCARAMELVQQAVVD